MRRRTRTSSGLLALLMVSLMGGTSTAAEAPVSAVTIQVELASEAGAAPVARAVLTATEAGTSLQVLVPGAAAGTTVVIHPGSCEAVGPDIVGLIGEVVTGQAQGVVPVALATLADGAHVVVLHPGIDFETVVACGQIPQTAVEPGPVVEPDPNPDPIVNEECVGTPEWVTTTKAYLQRITDLEQELARQVSSADYLATLASNIGQVQTIVAQLQSERVPASAVDAQQQLIAALQLGVEAAIEITTAFNTTDPTLYQQALTKANDANAQILKVRTAIGQLEGRCPAPVAVIAGGRS